MGRHLSLNQHSLNFPGAVTVRALDSDPRRESLLFGTTPSMFVRVALGIPANANTGILISTLSGPVCLHRRLIGDSLTQYVSLYSFGAMNGFTFLTFTRMYNEREVTHMAPHRHGHTLLNQVSYSAAAPESRWALPSNPRRSGLIFSSSVNGYIRFAFGTPATASFGVYVESLTLPVILDRELAGDSLQQAVSIYSSAAQAVNVWEFSYQEECPCTELEKRAPTYGTGG